MVYAERTCTRLILKGVRGGGGAEENKRPVGLRKKDFQSQWLSCYRARASKWLGVRQIGFALSIRSISVEQIGPNLGWFRPISSKLAEVCMKLSSAEMRASLIEARFVWTASPNTRLE